MPSTLPKIGVVLLTIVMCLTSTTQGFALAQENNLSENKLVAFSSKEVEEIVKQYGLYSDKMIRDMLKRLKDMTLLEPVVHQNGDFITITLPTVDENIISVTVIANTYTQSVLDIIESSYHDQDKEKIRIYRHKTSAVSYLSIDSNICCSEDANIMCPCITIIVKLLVYTTFSYIVPAGFGMGYYGTLMFGGLMVMAEVLIDHYGNETILSTWEEICCEYMIGIICSNGHSICYN